MGQVLDGGGSHQRKAGTRMFFLMRVGLLRGKPEPRGREFWRLSGELLFTDVLTRCLFAVALDEVGFEIQCLLLLSPFVQPCQELVTRCSQFSNYMSLFNYRLPKCINKDIVKAASSFVVRREDAKSADDSGLGGRAERAEQSSGLPVSGK